MSNENNRRKRYSNTVKIVEDSSFARRTNTSTFGATKSTEKRQQFILNANIPISVQRDKTTLENNATVTKVGAEYRLRATSDANSRAELRSARRGDYVSGNESEAGIGVRVATQPTGDAFVRWGYYEVESGAVTGLCFEYDADGISAVVYDQSTDRDDVVHRTYQQNWNIDRLDSGEAELNIGDGHIYQINFVYYGYGPIRWEIGDVIDANNYITIPVHQHKVIGGISISEPNLPLTIEVDSGTTGVQLDAFVGGRQFSTFGTVEPVRRIVGDNRILQGSIDTTYVPTISVREKTAFGNILTSIRSISFIPDVDMAWQIRVNGSLTGASFGNPTGYSASECATEWDKSATAITGGEVIDTGIVGGGNKASVTNADLPDRVIFEEDTYSLCVRRLTGTNGTVTTNLNMSEAW